MFSKKEGKKEEISSTRHMKNDRLEGLEPVSSIRQRDVSATKS